MFYFEFDRLDNGNEKKIDFMVDLQRDLNDRDSRRDAEVPVHMQRNQSLFLS